jgi:hypothetical protein
VGKPVLHFLN